MIDVNLSMKKTKKKMQSREGVSIVHFIEKESALMHSVNPLIDGLDRQIKEMFKWSNPESLHLTIMRCSSTKGKIETNQSLIDYVHDVVKFKSAIKIVPSQISLDDDGVIRLHFCTPLFTGLNSEILSRKSGGLRYKEIRYPWITLAYVKAEFIENLSDSGMEIMISLCKPDSYYIVDSFSIVKFYDTEFRKYEKLDTMRLGMANES